VGARVEEIVAGMNGSLIVVVAGRCIAANPE
jgi:hypothetical protein